MIKATDYKINIIVQTKKDCPNEAILRDIARKTLGLEGIKNNISINILFTDDKNIKALNRQFLNRNEPTDVISFGSQKGPAPVHRGWVKGFIGEVAISVETAEYNARRFDTTKEKEIFLYIIHGILHLLGYADKTKKEKKIIQKRQKRILETICGKTGL